MPVRLLNPEHVIEHPIYHQVAVATGTTQIHIAGQVAWDEYGRLVSDDLTEQVVQVYRNVANGLAAAGATFHDVVRITWYAARWQRSMYDAFAAGVAQAERELDVPKAPASLIGVDILFEEGILVEAEVTAVLEALGERPQAGGEG